MGTCHAFSHTEVNVPVYGWMWTLNWQLLDSFVALITLNKSTARQTASSKHWPFEHTTVHEVNCRKMVADLFRLLMAQMWGYLLVCGRHFAISNLSII